MFSRVDTWNTEESMNTRIRRQLRANPPHLIGTTPLELPCSEPGASDLALIRSVQGRIIIQVEKNDSFLAFQSSSPRGRIGLRISMHTIRTKPRFLISPTPGRCEGVKCFVTGDVNRCFQHGHPRFIESVRGVVGDHVEGQQRSIK